MKPHTYKDCKPLGDTYTMRQWRWNITACPNCAPMSPSMSEIIEAERRAKREAKKGKPSVEGTTPWKFHDTPIYKANARPPGLVTIAEWCDSADNERFLSVEEVRRRMRQAGIIADCRVELPREYQGNQLRQAAYPVNTIRTIAMLNRVSKRSNA